MRENVETEHISRQKKTVKHRQQQIEKDVLGKQEGLNPNIQSIMRLPLETEHGQRRRQCKTNMNKSATRKQSTVSFLCSWHDHQYSSTKMENSKLEVGASVCSQRQLDLYMWQAKRKTKKPRRSCQATNHLSCCCRKKSSSIFATITQCDGKVTLIRLYLVLCDEACGVNTKEATSPLIDCEYQSE